MVFSNQNKKLIRSYIRTFHTNIYERERDRNIIKINTIVMETSSAQKLREIYKEKKFEIYGKENIERDYTKKERIRETRLLS